MTIAYKLPASIEAEKAMAKARKVNPFRPLFNSTLSCMTFPFKLDRNCEIHIKEELMPKKAIIDVSSLLNENDGLKGVIISGYSKKPFPSPLIKKGSSTHQASFMEINKFVFARLEKSFKAIEDISHKLSL